MMGCDVLGEYVVQNVQTAKPKKKRAGNLWRPSSDRSLSARQQRT
jgi:hypothetical protein